FGCGKFLPRKRPRFVSGPDFKSAYMALMLLRSISWSARKLSSKEDVRRPRLLFPLLLILLLVEVASFGAMFSVVVFEMGNRGKPISKHSTFTSRMARRISEWSSRRTVTRN